MKMSAVDRSGRLFFFWIKSHVEHILKVKWNLR